MRRSSWIAGEVLALAVMAGATLGWMAFTSSGGQALLAVVQWASAGALSVAGAQGALLGNFQADHVQWHTPGGQGRIEQLAWQFDTRRLRFARLAAREVELTLPASASPGAPASLAVPVSVGVDALDIVSLTLHSGGSTTQLAQLSGSMSLGPLQHRWQLAGQVALLRVATQGTLDTQAPFATRAVADLHPADPAQAALDWAARLQADGPLTALPLSAQVRARGQSLDATATLTPWDASALSAVHLQLRDFDIAPLLAGAPRTTLSGTIDAQLTAGAPLHVDAQLHNGTAGPWDLGLLPLIDLTARGSGDRSSGRFDALEARVPGGGHVSGTAQWHTSAGQSAVDWRADLTLAQVRPALLYTAVTPMQLGGQLQLQGRSGGLQAAPLEVRAQLRGRLDDTRLAQRDVSVNADAQIGADSLTLRQLRATSGTAGLDLSGTVNQLHSTRRFDLQARLRAFTPDAWLRTGYTALLNADATAQGSWPRAQRMPQSLQGALQWRDSTVQGLPTQGHVQWALTSGSAVRVSSQGTLDVAGQQAQWSGAYGQPGDRLRLDWQVPQLQRLQALIALITPTPATLAGKLHGQLTLDSRADAPRLSGSMQGERLQWGTGAANTVTARVEAGPRPDDTLALDVAVNGLHVAALDRVTTGANDRINLNARVQGTWAAHDIALRTEATVSQHPLQLQLDVKGALRGGVMAATQWHGSGTAAVVEDGLAWARTDVLEATVEQPFSASPPFELHAQLQDLAAAPLLRRATGAAESGDGWVGDLLMGVSVDVVRRDSVRADLHLFRKRGDLGLAEAGQQSMFGISAVDLRLQGEQGRWSLTHAVHGARIGSIDAQAAWQLPPAQWLPMPGTPVQGGADLQVSNMDVWSATLPPGWRLGGSLRGQLRLTGSFGSPRGEGSLVATGLSVRNLLQGVDYGDGQARLVWAGNTLRLESLALASGGGTLKASGEADFERPPFRAQVKIDLQRFRVLSRVDRRIVASGAATLDATPRELQLRGALRVDEGLIDITRAEAPTLGDDVSIRRGTEADASSATAGPRRNVDMQLTVDLGPALRLRGRGLDTRLEGSLRLSTPQGRLAADGTLRAVDGTYAAYGQRLTIERGTLRFTGPVNAPQLDVLATRRGIDNEQQRVGVSVTGNALNPRVRLYADPDMSDTEKLAFLVSGRSFSALGRNDAALVQRAAFALLQGEGGGATDLLKAAGLDDFSVEQRANGTVQSTVVTLGKQISQRLYVGYERGLNATSGALQLIYRLSQRFTLRAQSGTSAGMDLIWQWSWN